MSIDQLANVVVTSVSKARLPLADAPAAIYVISHDEIVRSGARSLPEILRLAPNLQVFQTNASQYIITARGLNGNSNAQNFSNKLLVLIDGRSVYTPLYSGVYWDMQYVLPEDIERIEVISGPGATLWGANAVNGVINIITRKAGDTQGAFADVEAGALEQTASARYGATAGNLAYRVYVQGLHDSSTEAQDGTSQHDRWSRMQGGFRLDWAPDAVNAVSLEGDAFGGTRSQLQAPDEDIAGRNLTARWTHDASAGRSLQVEAYYDHEERLTQDDGGHFDIDTYDVDVQHSLPLGPAGNELIWGGGVRASRYAIIGNGQLYFEPQRRTLFLGNVFAQDTLPITGRLTLIAGVKAEDDPYVGVSLLPDARLSWKPVDQAMVWAAVSRAVRSPTPFDEDVREKLGSILYVTGSSDFRTEKVTAYETGVRVQPSPSVSFSVSGYYNDYDDLRSVELTPVTFLPLTWGNLIRGHSYGVEAWGSWQAASWWTLSAGADWLRERFRFATGASQLLGLSQLGDDPRHEYFLRSSMNIGRDVTLDANFRAIGALPDPHVPAYAELGGRIGWRFARHFELSLSGENLLHSSHREYPAPALVIPRSIVAGIQWRF